MSREQLGGMPVKPHANLIGETQSMYDINNKGHGQEPRTRQGTNNLPAVEALLSPIRVTNKKLSPRRGSPPKLSGGAQAYGMQTLKQQRHQLAENQDLSILQEDPLTQHTRSFNTRLQHRSIPDSLLDSTARLRSREAQNNESSQPPQVSIVRRAPAEEAQRSTVLSRSGEARE